MWAKTKFLLILQCSVRKQSFCTILANNDSQVISIGNSNVNLSTDPSAKEHIIYRVHIFMD